MPTPHATQTDSVSLYTMQMALHPHLDLATGLSTAFDQLIAGELADAIRTLHTTVAWLPLTSPSRDTVSTLLTTLKGPLNEDQKMEALLSLYGLLEENLDLTHQAV